jgi:sulfopyruvate decarboxylase TPP-binding subunit
MTVPDNATAPLLGLLASDPEIRLVPVTREGEAFAIAAGLWIGGKSPVVIVQNTGFLESGDSIRGTVQRMGVPVVIIVSYRGYAKLRSSGLDARARPIERDALTRPDLDSTAILTEPTLEAWGIPFHTLDTEDDVATITAAFRQARSEQRPVALLLTRTLA